MTLEERLLQITRWGFTLLAAALLALAYGLDRLWVVAGALLVLGLLAAASILSTQTWVPSTVLFLHALIAAAGFWINLQAALLVAGLVCSLTAWDLDHFARRLKAVGRIENTTRRIRMHITRLLTVSLGGFLLAYAALRVPVNLEFGAAFALGLLVVLALAQGLGYLRRSLP
ncbi:MAG: hypothetical protein GX495_21050 [Chloroflexi bacterium]|nr:hypothetical protein [Chloroflexota bacterium]